VGEDVLKRPFKVRTAERDRETDKDRILPILGSIEKALVGAKKEMDALKIRVRDARDLASFAVGTESDEYLSREAKDDRRISEYEQQMIAGEDRIRQLDLQIANLIELRNMTKTRFPDSRE
jgi:hypothetical protein